MRVGVLVAVGASCLALAGGGIALLSRDEERPAGMGGSSSRSLPPAPASPTETATPSGRSSPAPRRKRARRRAPQPAATATARSPEQPGGSNATRRGPTITVPPDRLECQVPDAFDVPGCSVLR